MPQPIDKARVIVNNCENQLAECRHVLSIALRTGNEVRSNMINAESQVKDLLKSQSRMRQNIEKSYHMGNVAPIPEPPPAKRPPVNRTARAKQLKRRIQVQRNVRQFVNATKEEAEKKKLNDTTIIHRESIDDSIESLSDIGDDNNDETSSNTKRRSIGTIINLALMGIPAEEKTEMVYIDESDESSSNFSEDILSEISQSIDQSVIEDDNVDFNERFKEIKNLVLTRIDPCDINEKNDLICDILNRNQNETFMIYGNSEVNPRVETKTVVSDDLADKRVYINQIIERINETVKEEYLSRGT